MAVGDSGLRVASPDGRTWQNPQTWTDTRDPLTAIAHGLGRFIAVGGTENTGHLLSSPDGEAWRELRCVPKKISAVAFGESRFVATQGPQLLVSTDGETFAVGDHLDIRPPAQAIQIACGDTEAGFRFVIIGESEPFPNAPHDHWRAVTGDGTRIESFTPQPPAYAIAYGAGHFVAVGRNRIESSHDGQTWSLQPCPGDRFTSVVWTGARFIATTMGAVWTSPDALTWHRESNPDALPLLWARDAPSPLFLGLNPAGLLNVSVDSNPWRVALPKIPRIRAVVRLTLP